MMTFVQVFMQYLAITGLGLLVAKMATYLLLRDIVVPERRKRKHIASCANESLRRATELRLDATAVYNQLSGKVQKHGR